MTFWILINFIEVNFSRRLHQPTEVGVEPVARPKTQSLFRSVFSFMSASISFATALETSNELL